VPNAGACGPHCVEAPGEKVTLPDGTTIRTTTNVFGTILLPRAVHEAVGYYNEAFNPYGMEDSDLHYRIRSLGYKMFYLDGWKSEHQGHDYGENTDYRRGKDAALARSAAAWGPTTESYGILQTYYVGADGQPGKKIGAMDKIKHPERLKQPYPIWIPVSERMPTPDDAWGVNDEVLVMLKNGEPYAVPADLVNSEYYTHWAKITNPFMRPEKL
jgi:hypothetical protein